MNIFLILGWILLIAGLSCWAYVIYCLTVIFRTRLLVELPLSEKFKDFKVTKKGGYAIWQKGPLLKVAPAAFIQPKIINIDCQQHVKLSGNIGRATKTGFTSVTSLMFYCELEIGNYRLENSEGSSLHPVEDKISQQAIRHLHLTKATNDQYSVRIHESLTKKQRIIMFICIFSGLLFFNFGFFTVLEIMTGVPFEGSLAP